MLSKKDNVWRLVLISVFITALFSGFIFIKRKFMEQEERVVKLQTMIVLNSQSITETTGKHELEFLKLRSKVQILDESVNTETKRKARIRRVRDVMKSAIDHFPDNEEFAEMKKLTILDITEISSHIVDASDEFDVPTAVLLGLIRQESAFNPKAISKAGAQGLTQVLPSTAEDIKSWLNIRMYNPWNSQHNIRFGAFYLSKMLHRFKDDPNRLDLALKAYNGGPELISKWKAGEFNEVALPQETREYAPRVLTYIKFYESKGVF